jgi:hypothetical protein
MRPNIKKKSAKRQIQHSIETFGVSAAASVRPAAGLSIEAEWSFDRAIAPPAKSLASEQ